jgi:hypothetical protein
VLFGRCRQNDNLFARLPVGDSLDGGRGRRQRAVRDNATASGEPSICEDGTLNTGEAAGDSYTSSGRHRRRSGGGAGGIGVRRRDLTGSSAERDAAGPPQRQRRRARWPVAVADLLSGGGNCRRPRLRGGEGQAIGCEARGGERTRSFGDAAHDNQVRRLPVGQSRRPAGASTTRVTGNATVVGEEAFDLPGWHAQIPARPAGGQLHPVIVEGHRSASGVQTRAIYGSSAQRDASRAATAADTAVMAGAVATSIFGRQYGDGLTFVLRRSRLQGSGRADRDTRNLPGTGQSLDFTAHMPTSGSLIFEELESDRNRQQRYGAQRRPRVVGGLRRRNTPGRWRCRRPRCTCSTCSPTTADSLSFRRVLLMPERVRRVTCVTAQAFATFARCMRQVLCSQPIFNDLTVQGRQRSA